MMANSSLDDFVQSVEWQGKTELWDSFVLESLAANDISVRCTVLEGCLGWLFLTVCSRWKPSAALRLTTLSGKRARLERSFSLRCAYGRTVGGLTWALCLGWGQEVHQQCVVLFGPRARVAAPVDFAGACSCVVGSWYLVLWRFVIAGGGNNDVGTQLQAALLSMCGKPVRELAHVDLGEKLAELGLARHFPDEVWL